MTSARKSALTAVVMFLLIAAVVMGGMAWATVTSFELAKKNVAEEHLSRAYEALGQIASMVQGFVNSEASRPYQDYADYHTLPPDAIESVITRDGQELEAACVIVRSQTAVTRPPYDWIDLYFQVDHKGGVSSPQFSEEDERLPLAALDPWKRRALENWSWFQRAYPRMNFRARVSEVLQREDMFRQAEPETTELVRVPQRAVGRPWRDFRRTSAAHSQRRYLPPEVCVSEQIAVGGHPSVPLAIDSEFEHTSAPPSPARIKPGPFAPPFWVEGGPGRGLKLAFVRECLVDADVNYQGFIADWDPLKPELLRSIADLFPDADLVPIPNSVGLDEETDALKLHWLPVLLRVPDIPGGTTTAAWRSVRAVLLISWIAALAVLITAGWGVRNLVALTERRLQFAYAVTHELRTPLTTFRLYSDMLSAGLVPDTSKQQYLDTLNRESQRLSGLVESVLEYARLENQKVRLHIAQTDAASLLRVLAETVDKRCEKNSVEGQTLSRLPAEHAISTDVNLVNQITAVLVDNACRHARSSSKPSLRVELAADNGRLHLDIVDSGPGVELADSRRIFRPFRRGSDADTTGRGGIGLGLALARNWASLLGGRLDLVSRHDPSLGGAHFRLTVPSIHEG
jgi:signal transduction histidine kinase